jgi:uncharacterized protein (TIGR00369 family)
MPSRTDPLTLAPGTSYGPFNFVLRVVEPGRSVWEYSVDPAHHNPNGSLHGGVMMTLLDTAMGFAVTTQIFHQGKFNAAAEMSTRFLAPVHSGIVRADATVVKLGKRLAIVEARATNGAGALLALASATHAVLP